MVFANPVPTRSLVLFQGLPEAITMPLSTCSHLVTISQKPDTKSHNSRFLRAVGIDPGARAVRGDGVPVVVAGVTACQSGDRERRTTGRRGTGDWMAGIARYA